jgi:hypothetical protein
MKATRVGVKADYTGDTLIASGHGMVCTSGSMPFVIHECKDKAEAEQWIRDQGAIVYQSPACPDCGEPMKNGQFSGAPNRVGMFCFECSIKKFAFD